jgi:aerobic-type carbon monoxide dehydrogenase small subunit (CoxS/CutS family)
MATITLTFAVNDRRHTIATEADRPLLDVLREDLQLTSAKYGCGESQCGACSVLLDGKRVFSCRTPVSRIEGKSVLTVEGLARGDQLHPVQQAFLDEGAFQCGYCTVGMIMTAVALLEETPRPTNAEISSGMNRNVCRCCSYPRIIQAVRRASGQNGSEKP